MLPFQRNKVDLSKLNPQEQQLLTKYGKLPTHKSVLMKMQKERKYFDSGDYALSKAGVAPQNTVGTAIPNPENIPHASTPGNGHGNNHNSLSISPTNSTSPVNRESGLAHNQETNTAEEDQDEQSAASSPAPAIAALDDGGDAMVQDDSVAETTTTLMTGPTTISETETTVETSTPSRV
jgi:hypothetical protein